MANETKYKPENLNRIGASLRVMIKQDAPIADIDKYLKSEDFTQDSFSKAYTLSRKAGNKASDYGFGRSALQGLTFGFSDELEAGLKSTFGGGTFEENLASINLAKTQYEEESPASAIAGQVIGGLPYAAVPFLGVAKYAQMAKNLGTAGRATVTTGASAATGALTGALGGAGEAMPEERLAGAKTGGLFGGGLGVAAPALGATVGKLGGKVVDVTSGIPVVQSVGKAVGAVTGQTIDAGQRAKAKLLEALYRDKVSLEDMRLQLASTSKPVGLVDIAGENVKSLADLVQKYPGIAKQEGREALVERGQGQASRIKSDLSTYLQNPKDINLFITDVSEKQRTTASPLYTKAFEAGKIINNPEINNFFEIPEFQKAYKKAQEIAFLEDKTRLPNLIKGAPLDLKTLDLVKRGLDDVIGEGKQQGGLVGNKLRLVDRARADFVDLLDKAEPNFYPAARKAWAGPAAIKDAVEQGQNFFKMDAKEVDQFFKNLNPGEQEGFRVGAAEALRSKIDRAKDSADAAKLVFGSMEDRMRLKALFPDEQTFTDFSKLMVREAQMRSTQEKILRGSQTAERQLGATGLEAEPSFFGQMVERGPVRGTLGYLQAQGQGVAGQTAEELSPLLFTLGNSVKNMKTLQELTDFEDQLRQSLARKTAATSGATAGLIPALTKSEE